MENGSINIEEIMAEIKRNIKEQGLTADMLSFEDVPYKKTAQGGSAAEAMDYLTSHYYIQPYKELKGNPIKVFIKKTLRKLMKPTERQPTSQARSRHWSSHRRS